MALIRAVSAAPIARLALPHRQGTRSRRWPHCRTIVSTRITSGPGQNCGLSPTQIPAPTTTARKKPSPMPWIQNLPPSGWRDNAANARQTNADTTSVISTAPASIPPRYRDLRRRQARRATGWTVRPDRQQKRTAHGKAEATRPQVPRSDPRTPQPCRKSCPNGTRPTTVAGACAGSHTGISGEPAGHPRVWPGNSARGKTGQEPIPEMTRISRALDKARRWSVHIILIKNIFSKFLRNIPSR